VLSGRVLCVGLIILPEESTECDRDAPNGEAMTLKRVEAPEKKNVYLMYEYHVTAWNERRVTFLGSFEKLREVTITFVMSVCPSVRTHVTTRLPLKNFHENLYLVIIRVKIDSQDTTSICCFSEWLHVSAPIRPSSGHKQIITTYTSCVLTVSF